MKEEIKIRTFSDEESIAFQKKAIDVGFTWGGLTTEEKTRICETDSRSWWLEWHYGYDGQELRKIGFNGSADEWFDEYPCPEVTLQQFLDQGIRVFDECVIARIAKLTKKEIKLKNITFEV